MQRRTAEEAAALVQPTDGASLGFGPAPPCALSEALRQGDGWEHPVVFGARCRRSKRSSGSPASSRVRTVHPTCDPPAPEPGGSRNLQNPEETP